LPFRGVFPVLGLFLNVGLYLKTCFTLFYHMSGEEEEIEKRPYPVLGIVLIVVFVAGFAFLVFYLFSGSLKPGFIQLPFSNQNHSTGELSVNQAQGGGGVNQSTVQENVLQKVLSNVSYVENYSFGGNVLGLSESIHADNVTHVENVSFENYGPGEMDFQVIEVIPKELANNLSEAFFENMPANMSVLQADPVIMYGYNMKAGGTESFSESMRGGVDSSVMRVVVLNPLNQSSLKLVLNELQPLQNYDFTAVEAHDLEVKLSNALNNPSKSFDDRLADIQNVISASVSSKQPEYAPKWISQNDTINLNLVNALSEAPAEPISISELNPTALFVIGVSKSLYSGDILFKGGDNAVMKGPFDDGDVRIIKIFFDFSSLLSGGSLPPEIDRNITLAFPSLGPDSVINYSIEFIDTPYLDPSDFVFPNSIGFNGFNGGSAEKPLFVVNNLPYSIEISGCGADRQLAPYKAYVNYASLSNSDCVLNQGGTQLFNVSLVNEFSGFDSNDFVSPTINSDAIDNGGVGWRSCSDSYCSCAPLQIALSDFLNNFYAYASSITESGNSLEAYNNTFGNTYFKMGVVIKAAELGSYCEIPEPFTDVNITSGTIQYVVLSTDLSTYPFFYITAANQPFSGDQSLAGVLNSGAQWLYATTEGLAVDSGANLSYTYPQRCDEDSSPNLCPQIGG
jgi:hypothetical protein